MNLRFPIASKISIGFGVFILAVGAFILITNGTLKTSREINNKINDVYTPSTRALEELRNQLLEGQYLIHHWAYNQSLDSAAERQQLRALMKREVPKQLLLIDSLSSNWSEQEKAQHEKLSLLIDTL
jgi:hypothetical protein